MPLNQHQKILLYLQGVLDELVEYGLLHSDGIPSKLSENGMQQRDELILTGFKPTREEMEMYFPYLEVEGEILECAIGWVERPELADEFRKRTRA